MRGTEGRMEVWGFCTAGNIPGDFPNCPDAQKPQAWVCEARRCVTASEVLLKVECFQRCLIGRFGKTSRGSEMSPNLPLGPTNASVHASENLGLDYATSWQRSFFPLLSDGISVQKPPVVHKNNAGKEKELYRRQAAARRHSPRVRLRETPDGLSQTLHPQHPSSGEARGARRDTWHWRTQPQPAMLTPPSLPLPSAPSLLAPPAPHPPQTLGSPPPLHPPQPAKKSSCFCSCHVSSVYSRNSGEEERQKRAQDAARGRAARAGRVILPFRAVPERKKWRKTSEASSLCQSRLLQLRVERQRRICSASAEPSFFSPPEDFSIQPEKKATEKRAQKE